MFLLEKLIKIAILKSQTFQNFSELFRMVGLEWGLWGPLGAHWGPRVSHWGPSQIENSILGSKSLPLGSMKVLSLKQPKPERPDSLRTLNTYAPKPYRPYFLKALPQKA